MNPTDLNFLPQKIRIYDYVNNFRRITHCSTTDVRKGNCFSILSIFARDCTAETGIMKKNVRKKKATAAISFLIVIET